MPSASGTIYASGVNNAVTCVLVDGSNTIAIRLLASGGPTFTMVGEYSQDNSYFESVSATLFQDLQTGGTGAPTTGGVWIVQLPGPGWFHIYASSYSGGGSVGVSMFVGSEIAGAVGQAPTLLSGYYVVQSSGSNKTYSGLAADFLGNVKALQIIVATGSPGSSNNLVACLNTAYGPSPPNWAWAVLFNVPVETLKFVGAPADYNGSNAKTYSAGTTLDAGPVPAEFLEALFASVTSNGALETVLTDAATQANVLEGGAGSEVGPNSLVTAPVFTSLTFDVPNGSSASTISFPEGIWTAFTITILSFPTVTVSVEGSNDQTFTQASLVELPMWQVAAQGGTPTSSLATTTTYCGSTFGLRYLRLRISAVTVSDFKGIIELTSMSVLPPIIQTADTGVSSVDYPGTFASGTAKNAPGNFFGAVVDNNTSPATVLYFNVYDGAVGGTLVFSQKVASAAEVVITPPKAIFCASKVSWNLSTGRGGPTYGTASQVYATILYN